MSVRLPNGDEYTDVRVIYAETRRDFAVILIKGTGFQTLKVGDSDGVVVGDSVVAIGNPRGMTSTFTSGIVSSVRIDTEEGYRFIQHQTPISPGSSGGPLLNLRGEVVGINTFMIKDAQNLNGAIPINYAKPYFGDPPTMTWQAYARSVAPTTPPPSSTPPPASRPPNTSAPLPSATPAPSARANTVEWTITNSCKFDVEVRFHTVDDKDSPIWVWPTDGKVYAWKANETLTATLGNCEHDGSKKICYGGQSKDGKLVWGAGLDGKAACETCCTTCGAVKTTTLTCQ
jgi:hypothetical protein